MSEFPISQPPHRIPFFVRYYIASILIFHGVAFSCPPLAQLFLFRKILASRRASNFFIKSARPLPRNNFTNRKRNVLFAIRRVPPPLAQLGFCFSATPGFRAGGAQIRELHCQARMIYLTNISIQPRTRISNEARQSWTCVISPIQINTRPGGGARGHAGVQIRAPDPTYPRTRHAPDAPKASLLAQNHARPVAKCVSCFPRIYCNWAFATIFIAFQEEICSSIFV